MIATYPARLQPRTSAGAGRAGRATGVLFAVAVLAQLVPLVLLPYVVTVDGPAHLAAAAVLAHPGDPAYRHFFRIDAFPAPNLLTEWLLAGLLRLTDPVTAEKALVGGYLVALPLALRYAARGVDRRAGWLAFAALPLAQGYLFWYGFYNYCYGLAVALVVVGLAVRRYRRWTPASAAALGSLLVLCYLTHLVPFAVVLLVLVVLAAFAGATSPAADRRRALLLPSLAALPALALTAAFALRGGPRAAPSFRPVGALLGGLASLALPVVTFDAREVAFAALTAVVLAGLTVTAVRRHGGAALAGPAGALAAAALASTLLYLFAPDRVGRDYGFINDRLSLFPPLLLVLWLAGQRTPARIRRTAIGLLLVAAAGLAAVRLPVQRHYGHLVAEYQRAAAVVPAGATLLAVRFVTESPPGGPVRNDHFDPLLHEADLLAARRRAVDVGLFSAELNYYPVRFRAGHDLQRRIDPSGRGLDKVPPRIRLDLAHTPRGDRIDYLLVVGAARARPDSPLLQEIAAAYRLVTVTRPTGLVEVWAHR